MTGDSGERFAECDPDLPATLRRVTVFVQNKFMDPAPPSPIPSSGRAELEAPDGAGPCGQGELGMRLADRRSAADSHESEPECGILTQSRKFMIMANKP